MKKSSPTGIGEILDGMIAKTKLGKHLEHAEIWERWPDIVGPLLMAHGRPVSVKKGELRIEVDSAVWMNKYAYRKWTIIRRINRMARKELVHDLFFILVEDGAELGELQAPQEG